MFTNNINPIIFEWQFISIRWYGLLLAAGVLFSIFLMMKLFKKNNLKGDLAIDLGIWLVIGGLIGARLGEILFYEPLYYFSHPVEVIMINHGGLSSHGMTIGLLITFFLFVKIKKIEWKKILDLTIISIPLLAGFIRLGNFTNSEIVGRATNLPWGVQFPRYELEPVLRHPSQLYEALLAFSIFYTLYFIYKNYSQKIPHLYIFHLFLLLYFSSRFAIEFLKEYQTLSAGLTMGQWLSVPFIIWGVEWFWRKYKPSNKNKKRA
jgi:phosphatidylglycerol---prolipoprotein diacylglyceryl transferase